MIGIYEYRMSVVIAQESNEIRDFKSANELAFSLGCPYYVQIRGITPTLLPFFRINKLTTHRRAVVRPLRGFVDDSRLFDKPLRKSSAMPGEPLLNGVGSDFWEWRLV
jgi:hypothetical protein